MYKAGQADAKTGAVDTGVSEAGAAFSEGSPGIENGTRPTETANGVQATETAEESSSSKQSDKAKTEQSGTTAQKPASEVNAELEAKLAPFGFTTEQRAVAEKVAETVDLKQIPGNYDKTTVQKIIQGAEVIKKFNAENGIDSKLSKEYNGNGITNKAGIPQAKVDEIIKTPKGSRSDPSTYLSNDYINNHKTLFKGGVTKISKQAPSGYAGPPGGTFVMPTSIVDDLIIRAGGSVSELERLLGLDPGELGTNPVRIDIKNPTGVRMPSGNEKGANKNWIPGGYTKGGIPEIIIDSPSQEEYTVKSIL